MTEPSSLSTTSAASHMPARRAPITPEALASLAFPHDPALSPDGKRTLFSLAEWEPGKPRRRISVWVAPTDGAEDGSQARPLIASAKNDQYARWSPDGQTIAFLSNRDEEGGYGKQQLYLCAADGANQRRLCAMPNGAQDLAWSPDGRRIAFTTLDGPDPSADPIVAAPDRHARLWAIPISGGQPQPLTPDGVTVWEYAWAPNSQSLALYVTAGPGETDWYRGQIGLVPATGGAIRPVVDQGRQAGALTWSPDGARLAWIAGEWSDRGLVGGAVFVAPVTEGGEPRSLTPQVEFSPSWLQWLPDGQRLLFCAWDAETGRIGLLDEASGEITTLASDIVVGENSWPRLSATPDARRFVTLINGPSHPGQLFLGTLAGPDEHPTGVEWRRLTRLNPLAEETWARVPSQRLTYTGAGGWEMHALYTPPLAETDKGDGPPPMVLVVHGGPTSAHRDDYTGWITQALASAGYAVLRPNPRGSIGRGVEFADAVLGDMGGADFEDLMRGVDEAIARGWADPNRLAIAGWSYGGFMTAWAVTQTPRFRAAMMGAGICDFHSFHAQTNIQEWDMRFLRATPNERPDVYRDHSAITFARNVTTPTLIIHGEKDPCVPVNQAYAFYHALREQGVPVELAVYPREGHGFVERDHLRDWVERFLRFLKAHL